MSVPWGKVPIVTSNLIAGAADVYGHTDGEIMKTTAISIILCCRCRAIPIWWRDRRSTSRPIPLPCKGDRRHGDYDLKSGIGGHCERKGIHAQRVERVRTPSFHSTALVHTVAYACLNDWDGLILYNHHTSEHWDDQPADEDLECL